MELEATRGTIVVYRSRNNESVGLTKSDRFRSVQIGHYYGHLERHVLGAGALATEDAITRAAVRQRWSNDCRPAMRTMAPVARRVPLIFGETGETYDGSSCGSSNLSTFLHWADAHGVGYGAFVRGYYAGLAAIPSP